MNWNLKNLNIQLSFNANFFNQTLLIGNLKIIPINYHILIFIFYILISFEFTLKYFFQTKQLQLKQ